MSTSVYSGWVLSPGFGGFGYLLVVISSTFQFICVYALFLRNLPNNVRGVMLSAYVFVGSVGTTIFALAGGFMFDKLGPSSPFTYVSILDLIVFAFAIILICMGKLKNY